jgi:hypothetical protein
MEASEISTWMKHLPDVVMPLFFACLLSILNKRPLN